MSICLCLREVEALVLQEEANLVLQEEPATCGYGCRTGCLLRRFFFAC
jgi:hypothetical protein